MSDILYDELIKHGAPKLDNGWSYEVSVASQVVGEKTLEMLAVSVLDRSGNVLAGPTNACGTAIPADGVAPNLARVCFDLYTDATRDMYSLNSRSLWVGVHP